MKRCARWLRALSDCGRRMQGPNRDAQKLQKDCAGGEKSDNVRPHGLRNLAAADAWTQALLLSHQAGAFFVCTDQKTWSCLRFVKSSRAHSGKTDPLQGCPAIVGGALSRCAARLNRHAVEIRSRVAEMASEVKSVVGPSEPLDVRPDSARRANRVAALSKTNFNSLLTRVRIGASRSRYSQGRRVSWPMNQGPKVRRCR